MQHLSNILLSGICLSLCFALSDHVFPSFCSKSYLFQYLSPILSVQIFVPNAICFSICPSVNCNLSQFWFPILSVPVFNPNFICPSVYPQFYLSQYLLQMLSVPVSVPNFIRPSFWPNNPLFTTSLTWLSTWLTINDDDIIWYKLVFHHRDTIWTGSYGQISSPDWCHDNNVIFLKQKSGYCSSYISLTISDNIILFLIYRFFYTVERMSVVVVVVVTICSINNKAIIAVGSII